MTKPNLMVTPYAPYRDGIATYAIQEVRSRMASGENLEVLSQLPSAAHHHLALGNLRGVAALMKRANKYERITFQFYPELLFGTCRNRIERILVWRALQRLAKMVPLEFRIHEVTYATFENSRQERKAAKALFEAAAKVTAHTHQEADRLTEALGLRSQQIELYDHGQHFKPAASMSQKEARDFLGIEGSGTKFLCIGFLQSHKGFDRAAAAIAAMKESAAQLFIVGSTRVDVPELIEYAKYLESIAQETAGVEFRKQYVSDHDFDAWIIASDVIVLPYREIWSSGVMERAKLFGKRVIASDVGGLSDQADENAEFFSNDTELVKLMAHACGADLTDKWEQIMESAELKANELASAIRSAAGTSAEKPRSGAMGSKKLRQMTVLTRPSADSPSKPKQKLKMTILRLINWQVDPVANHVTELQEATLSAVRDLEARVDALEEHSSLQSGSSPATSAKER